ncbi:MAG: type II secretion system protein GspG [Bdellovibrionota bacterium]
MLHKKALLNGFTMVELLMTITLIAVISAVATTQYIDYRDDARRTITEKKLYEYRDALAGNPELLANGSYIKPGIIIDVREVPTSLDALVSQGSYSSYDVYEKRGWRGPYVNSAAANWNVDAWGNPISYDSTSRTLKSCGPDGICGDTFASDDITVGF